MAKAVGNAVQEMEQATQELYLSTPGGRFHVRWDENGNAIAMGQVVFFAEFSDKMSII